MKLNFSQRSGLAPIPAQMERGEISKIIRNKLVNLIQLILKDLSHGDFMNGSTAGLITRSLHINYFVLRPSKYDDFINIWNELIERHVLSCEFNEVLDFIEYFVSFSDINDELISIFADVFENHQSAYRLIDNQFVEISSEEEIETIKNAHKNLDAHKLHGAKLHLSKSSTFLRNGQWSDSIRESIHAVESVACKISSEGTLGKALSKIEKTHQMHPALKEGFKKIYGYTSNEQGIRHALIDGNRSPTEQEALLMFSSCASFISYLTNFIPEK